MYCNIIEITCGYSRVFSLKFLAIFTRLRHSPSSDLLYLKRLSVKKLPIVCPVQLVDYRRCACLSFNESQKRDIYRTSRLKSLVRIIR